MSCIHRFEATLETVRLRWENCCSWYSSQPHAVQITSSSSENVVLPWLLSVQEKTEVTCSQDNASDHRSAQALAAIQSKLPALNYSVTHRIRHSCSYCTEKKRAQKKGGKVEKEKKRKKGKKNKAFAVTTERLRVSQRGRNESQITLNVNAAKTLNIFITCNFQAWPLTINQTQLNK